MLTDRMFREGWQPASLAQDGIEQVATLLGKPDSLSA